MLLLLADPNFRETKLELHYYFNDEAVHSMNAVLRNDNERDLLAIAKEISQAFGLEVEIESEALKEGGLRSLFRFKLTPGQKVTLAAAMIGAVAVIVGAILSRPPAEDNRLTELKIKQLEITNDGALLENERKRLELRKLREQLEGNLSEAGFHDTIKAAVEICSEDYKVIVHRSNFYKRLLLYPRVNQVSTTVTNTSNVVLEKEKVVERHDFKEFILKSDRLRPNVDEEAVIEIISPVLKEGNFQWKGFYRNDAITFHMKDEAYKNGVVNKLVEFSNGYAIKCVLVQERKLDAVGVVTVVSNTVTVVLEEITIQFTSKTSQGERYLRNKKDSDSQLEIFDKN